MRLGFGRVSAFVLIALFMGGVTYAQDPGLRDSEALEVQLGLGGVVKLGHLTPLRIEIAEPLRDQAVVVAVQTVDGDGVELVYRHEIADVNRNSPYVWASVRVGRVAEPLVIRLLDSADEVLAESAISLADQDAWLPSDQPFVVALGSFMGVDQLSLSRIDGSVGTFATTLIESADLLPPDWKFYSACDLVVFSAADDAFLASITSDQWDALDTWIRRGGGCIISLDHARSIPPEFQRLMPGRVAGTGQIANPGTLESLVATDSPMQGFPTVVMEQERGRVELPLIDSLSRDLPWWITYAHGHGTVQFLSSDLDSPAFAAWKDRKLLWERLLKPYIDVGKRGSRGRDSGLGTSSYLGYSDLVGQLRASLDVFPSVRSISFGQLAAILIGILILIGPVDYYVSVKWLKRPDFSWYFAGGVLLCMSIGLAWLYQSMRPNEIKVNTAQIIDIDTQSGAIGGTLWSHIYSSQARTMNVTANAVVDSTDIVSADQQQAKTPAVWIDWQGLPGQGLGGLQSQLSTDRGMPAYEIEIDSEGGSRLEQVGVPAAGTKCLTATWTTSVEMPQQSQLEEIPGVDQLSGTIVNPLNVDIKEPMLLYHEWYYNLNSRIPANERIVISYDTIPKDISRRLNRRRTVDGTDAITPWDPAERNEIDRLLELMMFHKAASGTNYSSLTHRYQPQIDQSNLLQSNYAILVGRLEQPWVEVDVTLPEQQSNQASEIEQDLDRVWVRILIPVARPGGK